MARTWIKVIPPKKVQELMNIYQGIWLPQMDRAWESDDGYSVMSRRIRTKWGTVEHVTISRLDGTTDVSWSVKQEIKDELFGFKSMAIEVFPSKKNLVDVCNVYHLWVLPKDFALPFGIHPIRDPQCDPVERGYDFDISVAQQWVNGSARAKLMGKREENLTEEQFARIEQIRGMLNG